MAKRKARAKSSPPAWEDRIVGHDKVAPSALLANPKNWRLHPAVQKEALGASMDNVGFVKSLTVNKRTGFVVDGHLRLTMALDRKQPLVPVEYVDLSEEEEAIVLATVDPIGALAEMNREAAAALFGEIGPVEGLDNLLDELRAAAGLDELSNSEVAPPKTGEAEALHKAWGTEEGQVWACGPHRVMCGDATKREDVEKLLDGARPAIMVTDPPYGVKYNPGWRNEAAEAGKLAYAARRIGKVKDDHRVDWREAWALSPASIFYVWHAGRHSALVQGSIESAGIVIRNQIVWVKPHFPISRGHYTWRHEPCFYGLREGADASWCGVSFEEDSGLSPETIDSEYSDGQFLCWYGIQKGRPADWCGNFKQSTVWEVALDPNVDGGHSTQKPIELWERPLRNHKGDLVDFFAGTGVGLMAAHRRGRVSFSMELDPAYVAVILERYKETTGEVPVLCD